MALEPTRTGTVIRGDDIDTQEVDFWVFDGRLSEDEIEDWFDCRDLAFDRDRNLYSGNWFFSSCLYRQGSRWLATVTAQINT